MVLVPCPGSRQRHRRGVDASCYPCWPAWSRSEALKEHGIAAADFDQQLIGFGPVWSPAVGNLTLGVGYLAAFSADVSAAGVSDGKSGEEPSPKPLRDVWWEKQSSKPLPDQLTPLPLCAAGGSSPEQEMDSDDGLSSLMPNAVTMAENSHARWNRTTII